MSFDPTSARTLEGALRMDPDWFDDQRLSPTPDLDRWAFLTTMPSLCEMVAQGHELNWLVGFGSEAEPNTWTTDPSMTDTTRQLVDRIGRLVGNNLASGSILFWGYDSLILWIASSVTKCCPGFVYYQEGNEAESPILVREIRQSDILDAALESWRRGGHKSAAARKWLCDSVVLAVTHERQLTACPV
jgi:hypothetical protein